MTGPISEVNTSPGSRLWLRVQITGFVCEGNPDFLSCSFRDVHGRTHTLCDKAPVLTTEYIDFAHAVYPRPDGGVLECVVLPREESVPSLDSAARSVVRVETCAWWLNVFKANLISHEAFMQADDPPQIFEVYADQLVARAP
jgi:hypothetical protein